MFESELLLLLLQIFPSRELAAKVNLLKGIENWSVAAQSVVLKSDNLQYNMLVCCIAGTNDSSTKRLMLKA